MHTHLVVGKTLTQTTQNVAIPPPLQISGFMARINPWTSITEFAIVIIWNANKKVLIRRFNKVMCWPMLAGILESQEFIEIWLSSFLKKRSE